jgi:hypothetical protein
VNGESCLVSGVHALPVSDVEYAFPTAGASTAGCDTWIVAGERGDGPVVTPSIRLMLVKAVKTDMRQAFPERS